MSTPLQKKAEPSEDETATAELVVEPSFYDKPHCFVTPATKGTIINIAPASDPKASKRRFKFENHQLIFTPEEVQYRDRLLELCEQHGFPIKPVDRTSATAIALQHARMETSQMLGSLSAKTFDGGFGMGEIRNLAFARLREAGQTVESVAAELGLDPSVLQSVKLDQHVHAGQIETVVPGDKDSTISDLLGAAKGT
mgnify:CR=1 FL=1